MELEKWIAYQLSCGVEVNRLFPCKYDSENGGFGYEITLSREEAGRTQYYKVMLLRKSINEQRFVISEVLKARWDRNKDEYEGCLLLEGKQVTLFPKEASTYAYEVSPFTITGTLILVDKLS